MSHPNKKRLRRSMMFLNCQKPGLIKDPYIYRPDSIMLDLEDAVAENQKDAARYSLFHALQEIDYRGVERVVRINGLDTPHWKEDIRVCVAGGADTIRIAKTESAKDVHTVEEHVLAAEKEFGRPEGSTLLMAALESCRGVLNALEVCESSDRLIGIALSGGDYTKDLQTVITGTGVELQGARQQMIIAARAAKVQCWDTVFTNLDAMDVFEEEVKMIKMMGFDGKSLVNPRQIDIVHKIFTPSQKEIMFAEKVVREIEEKKALGIGVFTVDGKMIDIAFYDGAKRTIALAKASGVYEGICKMINAVGRDIPQNIIEATKKEVFKGAYAFDNYEYTKAAPKVRAVCDPKRSKLVENIHEALVKCGVKDNMTISFHHHFREGDYIVNMVMEEIHKIGIKGLTICASSLGKAHDPIVPMIEDGTIVGIQSSGVRGKIGEAISTGKLRDLAIMRSHGGRVRAVESGEVHIDIAFIGAPTCDEYGNMKANGGKSDCGVLSYAMVDAEYADKVVAITDCLVPFPNAPASISMVHVDYVCVVDEIGNPAKIATGAAKPTTDVRKIMMADYCTQFVINTPYFKEGFSYQTGVGGASIASTISLGKIMEERGIHMGLGLGGITTPMCNLLEKGLIRTIVDTQDFDMGAIESIKKNPNHIEISASEYANPFNKGAYVNKLDFVILASLEVDVNFNCNVVVGSDGMITGAQGGHPDTAAGAKCTIVIAPLLQGRIPAICSNVTTVTTPGETVDVVITDYGIAINPRRQDLIDCMKDVKLPFCTIEELRDRAYAMVGEPDPVQFGDRIVGVIEGRDGTIMDVVREIKAYEFQD